MHFFDIHFLEDRVPGIRPEACVSELRSATRLAIAVADRVIVPAASYVESPLCRQILDEHAEIYGFGIVDIVGNAPNLPSFAEQKLATYRSSSTQAAAYASLDLAVFQPPFHTRSRGATSDLKKHWKNRVESGSLISYLGEGTGHKFPSDFEDMWNLVPERLESQAFVVEHIEEHLGEAAHHRMIRHRLHSVINEGYFGSYTLDFQAGIVTDLDYFQADYLIPSHGRDLPYKHLINQLRQNGLLAHVMTCKPMELLELRQDPRWIEILGVALERPSQQAMIEAYTAQRKAHMAQTQSQEQVEFRSFIVHGHDARLMLELKDYLQNTLKQPEPTILQQKADGGRSLIEKFEDESAEANLVFVCMTPDDVGGAVGKEGDERARARQNVIFEMGYFYGRLARKSGRVILLHKGTLEIPSDLQGILYIDVTQGITAAGENIRRELDYIQNKAKRSSSP